MKRRDFLKGISIVGGATLLPKSLFASEEFSDYKALIVLNFEGGNDAMNMFIPTETEAYSQYSTIRGDLAVSDTNLFEHANYNGSETDYFSNSTATNHPYSGDDIDDVYLKGSYHTGSGLGINGIMPELANLYEKGVLSLVSNIGTLVEPTTKEGIENETAELPVFLFAHNHQQRAVQTAQADILGNTGWAGRVADNWKVNGSVGLNISYSGVNRALIGSTTSPLAMETGEPTSYSRESYDESGESISDFLTKSFSQTDANAFQNIYFGINSKVGQLSELLSTVWESAPDFSTFTAKNSYGEDLFSTPELSTLDFYTDDDLKSYIFEQLEAVAKMIKLGKESLNYKRQIFYVRDSSYDTHSSQIEGHSRNLRSASLGISDLYKALEEMGLDEKVLIIQTSEFGRTLQNNGDGTDHGWGGNTFMVSGDPTFQGGNIFGNVMTDLNLDGVNAYTDRARMIPTTSIEQMLAPALKWFGVSDSLLPIILPNLVNFKTDDSMESAFLKGVFS